MITTHINYLRLVRGMSPRTCEEYEKELRSFARWAQERGARWSTISREDIEDHVRAMAAQGLMPATIKKRVTALRSLFSWLVNHGQLAENPAKWVQTPKINNTLPITANVADIDNYLEALPIDAVDIDVKLATAIMLEAGLRLDETINLTTEQIDRESQAIRIKGKGGRERITYYGDRTAKLLAENRRWRQGRILDTRTGANLRWAMYKYAGKYAHRLHPHQLRHTFATEHLNNGMSLKTLSQLMGHANTTTTERYARMTTDSMRAEYMNSKF